MISPESRPRIWGATGRIQGLRKRVTVELQRAGYLSPPHHRGRGVTWEGRSHPSPPHLQRKTQRGDSRVGLKTPRGAIVAQGDIQGTQDCGRSCEGDAVVVMVVGVGQEGKARRCWKARISSQFRKGNRGSGRVTAADGAVGAGVEVRNRGLREASHVGWNCRPRCS